MSHKRHYVNSNILAKRALNFLSSQEWPHRSSYASVQREFTYSDFGGSMRHLLLAVAIFSLLGHVSPVEARGCTWRVQGKILDSNKKPAAKIKVKIQARLTQPRGLWNDPNWPDPQTDQSILLYD